MKVLVVTGGIGSGKSLVCRILAERFGIPVYEADKRAKALYSEVPGMISDIEDALGCVLRNDSGDFVPHKLADVIFNDKCALHKVEEILFPVMMADFSTWADGMKQDVVAFESATILEKPQFDGFGDIVLLVDAPVELRLIRASERDRVDQDRVKARMSAQQLMNRLSEGDTSDKIDYVVKNVGSIEDLNVKLSEFVEKYQLTKML